MANRTQHIRENFGRDLSKGALAAQDAVDHACRRTATLRNDRKYLMNEC